MKILSRCCLFGLLWLCTASYASNGSEPDDLLPPEEAFKASAEVAEGEGVRVTWDIADGYFLYRSKIKVQTPAEGVVLGDPDLPPGKVKQDEFFGEVETYRHQISFTIPVTLEGKTREATEFVLKSQGCADIGVCYPPQTRRVSLDLKGLEVAASAPVADASPPDLQSTAKSAPIPALAISPTASSTPSPLASGPDGSALSALTGLGETLGFAEQDEEFLDPDQAFQFSARVLDPKTVIAGWVIADDYYLYKHRFKFKLLDAEGVRLGAPRFPSGKEKEDEFFGQVTTYYHSVEIPIPVARSGTDSIEIELEVGYQGCAEAGLCYPPQTKTIPLLLPALTAAQTSTAITGVGKHELEEGNSAGDEAEVVVPTPPEAKAAAAAPPGSEEDSIALTLASGKPLLILATFFGFGLLLAFTPCVFPMIPILSSIIVGQGGGLTTRRAFVLSLVYVLAMAVTYTVAGVVAGVAGENLQALFQNPWILGSFSLVFVLLALSMFGFYELQLPSSLQSKLTEMSNRQHGGTLTGVAIMGLLSALIVGPCVAPPLMGALIYIGQTGDAVLGGAALFFLSLGMGAPLLVIGTLGGRWLPRAGGWMDAVKAVFGVLLLAVAIWMLERIIPEPVALLLWAALFLISAVYLGALDSLPAGASGWRRLWKGIGVILAIYGVLLMIGVATGGGDLLRPLRGAGGAAAHGSGPATGPEHLVFEPVVGLDGLQQALKQAEGKPVMLDFYADWCVECKRMEKYTFDDPGVVQALSQGVVLQANVTAMSEQDEALLRNFGLIGPPAILFFDTKGVEKRGWRFVGYKDAEAFRKHVESAFQ